MFWHQFPFGKLGTREAYLIVLVVVEAIAGRLVDALIVTKQKPRIADTARAAGRLAVGLGALTGCRACTQFKVGICRAAL